MRELMVAAATVECTNNSAPAAVPAVNPLPVTAAASLITDPVMPNRIPPDSAVNTLPFTFTVEAAVMNFIEFTARFADRFVVPAVFRLKF
jgi:hypothetical protein